MDGTTTDASMRTMISDPLRINIWVIAAAKFWEHLGSWQVSQTSLVDPGPVNNWNWRSLVRNRRYLSRCEDVQRIFENIPQFFVDRFHHLLHLPPPRFLHGKDILGCNPRHER